MCSKFWGAGDGEHRWWRVSRRTAQIKIKQTPCEGWSLAYKKWGTKRAPCRGAPQGPAQHQKETLQSHLLSERLTTTDPRSSTATPESSRPAASQTLL